MLLRGFIFQKLLLAWKYPCINKNRFLSRRWIPLAKLLHAQFIHLTYITLRSNIQLLSNMQYTYQYFRVTSWFDTVCNFVTRCVNLNKTICMNMTYHHLTAIFRSISTQILCISGIIYNFSITPWKVHKQNCKYIFFYQKFVHMGEKILLNFVVG